MTTAARAERPPLDSWLVQKLRFTLFPAPAAQVTERDLWQDLIGQPPDSRTEVPKQGRRWQEGAYEQGKLVMAIDQVRIDWILEYLGTPEREIEGAVPGLPFSQALNALRSLMNRWFALETCPPAVRLAFGAVLLQPVSSGTDGYKRLALYLPAVKLDATGSSDFYYRINRPRESASAGAGLKINRLSTWSVVRARLDRLLASPESAQYTPGAEYFGCQLELDINTAPSPAYEFSRQQMAGIFDELTSLGKEIAQKGDVP